ncbi:tripartite tricarboxylate transporter permease [Sporosarcina aquimarina]|uniref:tripartite tricarboxylate transporter permease n=1 Tax=Sporosarcina aquimarina TaxID=114975 RepID=UPI001C8DC184|nr:tripartite tricarboxylate transporter permease [Sporosarcina aquimarina]MBY0223474.1 tripartite tricarboxylate transporter permease [Sporosarcina aquimarina]
MSLLMEGIVNILHWDVLLFLTFGTLLGIIIGSLPGLTSTMGVALMLPLTFGMDAVTGILLLIGVYFGSVYGGSLTAILINTPGTPASAATVIDGYPLTQKGKAQKALTVSTLSCAIGGLVSVIVLILVAPQLANFALKFSAPESFALALFGLSIVSSIAGDSLVKGLMAGTLGLLIASIGLDPIGGFPRFTFGMSELSSGINFIPIMIGLFAASEAFKSMEDIFTENKVKVTIDKVKLKWLEFKGLIGTILRSAGIGTFTGMVPGAGADIAAFVAYNEAKRFAKNKEEFGKGDLRGVAAPEAAGNSVTGGAMIPLLTLGIPGDAVTAVLLGALMVQGLQPGPMLFESNGPIVYTLFVGMLLANVLLLVFGLLGIRLFTKVLLIPQTILTPLILMLCVVGAYSLGNNYFDIVVMFIAGVVGYFFKRFKIPASPVILGLILGPMLESNFRRALVMSQGDLSIFYTRPITVVLLVIAVITLFTPLFSKKLFKKS